VIDPTASSTAEIVFRLVGTIGGAMPDATAICLYAGIVTDTGRFQYGATTPETLRVAAELRERPFDHARLVQALYEDNRFAYVRLLGTALQRAVLEPEEAFVWTYLTQADLQEAGVHPQETDDLIDAIRTAREADVAAVVKQQRDGRFKVSMRSRGEHDVAAVAAAFGGGGHRLAAGYTSQHGLAETVDRIRAALRGEPVTP
jgi:phosphoesterase RecJ-like protein